MAIPLVVIKACMRCLILVVGQSILFHQVICYLITFRVNKIAVKPDSWHGNGYVTFEPTYTHRLRPCLHPIIEADICGKIIMSNGQLKIPQHFSFQRHQCSRFFGKPLLYLIFRLGTIQNTQEHHPYSLLIHQRYLQVLVGLTLLSDIVVVQLSLPFGQLTVDSPNKQVVLTVVRSYAVCIKHL